MTATMTVTAVPTGGAIMVSFENEAGASSLTGSVVFSRSADGGSTFTTLYSGPADDLLLWPDVGDGLPAPLNPSVGYVYRVTDDSGTVTSDPVYPASQITVEPDGMTTIMIRLLQAGVNNLSLPSGVARALVSNQMPITGFPQLPFVVVNLDLIRQTDVPIGQNAATSTTNTQEIAVYVKRMWRVSVLTKSAEERDFYRDSLIAIWQTTLGSVFAPMGRNIRHKFEVASGQLTDAFLGLQPGFSFAEILFEVDGQFNTTLTTAYNTIQNIGLRVT